MRVAICQAGFGERTTTGPPRGAASAMSSQQNGHGEDDSGDELMLSATSSISNSVTKKRPAAAAASPNAVNSDEDALHSKAVKKPRTVEQNGTNGGSSSSTVEKWYCHQGELAFGHATCFLSRALIRSPKNDKDHQPHDISKVEMLQCTHMRPTSSKPGATLKKCTLAFCGSCLSNRYSESIANVKASPAAIASWSCPRCRDICNCSVCRR